MAMSRVRTSDLLAPGDRAVDDHEHRGDHDGDEPAGPVESTGLADADLGGQPVADQGAQHTEDDGDDQVDVLLAREDEPGEHTDDGSEDDGADPATDA